ncbi:MAG: hypothetical protein EZS28_026366 [Streblomastix strix]|uniref:Uncharacterized protein n=1 Tax=Streblomastix strix TaxID=222440 RepID=A0A5J4V5K0_9EUKA|nr:MAG: hypothetical protein EZS28_026366 [Streblomastix strix]
MVVSTTTKHVVQLDYSVLFRQNIQRGTLNETLEDETSSRVRKIRDFDKRNVIKHVKNSQSCTCKPGRISEIKTQENFILSQR